MKVRRLNYEGSRLIITGSRRRILQSEIVIGGEKNHILFSHGMIGDLPLRQSWASWQDDENDGTSRRALSLCASIYCFLRVPLAGAGCRRIPGSEDKRMSGPVMGDHDKGPAARRSRLASHHRRALGAAAALFLFEQLGQLVYHGAAELFGVDDGHRTAVVAGHVVADADRQQLDR